MNVKELLEIKNKALFSENEYIDALKKYLQLKRKKSVLEKQIKEAEIRVDVLVAFDDNLKNDRQRNAQKYQILTTDLEYIKLTRELEEIENDLIEADIELQHKKNLFKIELETLRAMSSLTD